MKKLILLIGFLIMSLNSFSQTDTTKTAIANRILRLVAKDLIKLDGCQQELKLTQEKVIKIQEREIQKDTIIKLLNDKDENNKFIIHQQGLQIGQYENLTNDLHKELKKQKTKSFIWKLTTYLGLISTSYFLLN